MYNEMLIALNFQSTHLPYEMLIAMFMVLQSLLYSWFARISSIFDLESASIGGSDVLGFGPVDLFMHPKSDLGCAK